MEKQFGKTLAKEYLRTVRLNFETAKSYVEKSIAQLDDKQIHLNTGGENNSIAVIMQHITGNLFSRFTEFFSADGEKPDRNRSEEFVDHNFSKKQLLEKWNDAWRILFDLLDTITDEELAGKIVYIRNEPHSVIEAINRQAAHYNYHAGQVVLLAKQIKGNEWRNLSIPKKK